MRTYLLTLCILFAAQLHAQLCQGSLGDPVVQITFGANNNTGPLFSSRNTNYQYVPQDCPQDGYYTVRNHTADCFMDSWNYITQDHTGDAGGNFMLINASYQPSDFYLDTVKGLCPGTTYEFAAWIANMLRPYACRGNGIKPNITFKIETAKGDLLGRYDTGDIADSTYGAAIWRQYGLFFTMPQAESQVVVRMTNNAPGGCGNDLALDDITFRPCGPTLSASILGGGDVANVCDGQSNIYNLIGQISTGFNNPALQWQTSTDNGVTWSDITNSTGTQYTKPQTYVPGEYLYRMVAAEKVNINNASCRVNSNVVTVQVNALPQINVHAHYSLCTNDTLKLIVTGGYTYTWSGPNSYTSHDSSIIVPNPPTSLAGTWYTQSTSKEGCESFDTTIVKIFLATTANAGNDVSLCQGKSVQLNGTGTGSYSWSPATGLSSSVIADPLASPQDTTVYIFSVTDANNCIVKDSVQVNVLKNPEANAGPDKRIHEGEFVQLDGTAAGTNVSYTWRPFYNIDNAAILQPMVHPTQDTLYTLTVTSQVGCGSVSDAVLIRVLQKVEIPNAFSPNGDGINDVWNMPKLITYPEADVYVYNRFGQPVFHSRGYSKPWDGTLNGNRLPFGTYYYMIDLKNDLPKLSGWVQIIY